jgi:hypothetical protein
MPNVEIGAAISQSFRFLGTAWGRAWGILLILVWVTAANQAVQSLRPEWIVVVWPLGVLLTLVASTALLGALYRIGFEGQHADDPNFRANAGGLQWGGLEWRVLGANLLIGLIFGGVALVVGLIWAVLFTLLAQGQAADLQALQGSDQNAGASAFFRLLAGPAGLVSAVILIPTFCAWVYFSARLALYPLVAADTRAFSFGRAWALSQGAALAIIVTWIVIASVQLLVGLIAVAAAGAIAVVAHQGGGVWTTVAWQLVAAAIDTPLSVGLLLYVYNTRRPGDAGIAATFA